MADRTGIGIGVGSFADAFFRARQLRDEEARRNKIASLQGKLIEEKLKAGETLDSMLSGTLGEFKPSGTEMTPGGHQIQQFQNTGQEPMSLSQILSDPKGILAAMKSGNFEGLTQGATLQNQTAFTSALDQSGMTPQQFLQTPKGATLGLKAGFQLPSSRKPAILSTLEGIGVDPMSDQGKAIVLDSLKHPETDALMSQLQLELANIKRQQEQGKLNDAEAARQQARAAMAVNVRGMYTQAQEIVQLQKDLSGTLSAVGIPYGDLVQSAKSGGVPLLERFGWDLQQQKAIIAKHDRLKKLLNKGLIEQLEQMKNLGNLSQGKIAALQRSTMGIDNQAMANNMVLADRLQASLDAAEVEGMDIPNRAEIEQFIADQRAWGGVSPQAKPIVDIPKTVEAISGYTREQINKLDPSEVETWTKEKRDALDKRLTELGL